MTAPRRTAPAPTARPTALLALAPLATALAVVLGGEDGPLGGTLGLVLVLLAAVLAGVALATAQPAGTTWRRRLGLRERTAPRAATRDGGDR